MRHGGNDSEHGRDKSKERDRDARPGEGAGVLCVSAIGLRTTADDRRRIGWLGRICFGVLAHTTIMPLS